MVYLMVIMGKLFSIILVNYNCERYIDFAFKSLLRQDRDLFELIYVDGGSTDKSNSIAKQYSHIIDIFISEKDSGQSDAINKGISLASGQYTFWLNSDDMLFPNSLERIGSLIREKNISWCSVGTLFIDEVNSIKKVRIAHSSKLIADSFLVNVRGPSAIVKTELLKSVGLLDVKLKYCMDTDLWCRLTLKHGLPEVLSGVFWCFRLHTDSKTSSSHLGNTHPAHYEEYKALKFLYAKKIAYLKPQNIFSTNAEFFIKSFLYSIIVSFRWITCNRN